MNGPAAINGALLGGKPAAGKLWIEDSKSNLSPELVGKIVSGPQVRWTLTPEVTMKFADFMSGVGTLKVKAATWKDYFFQKSMT